LVVGGWGEGKKARKPKESGVGKGRKERKDRGASGGKPGTQANMGKVPERGRVQRFLSRDRKNNTEEKKKKRDRRKKFVQHPSNWWAQGVDGNTHKEPPERG